METLFLLSNLVVLPFWLLMIIAPTWRLTRNVMIPLWPVLIVPVIYTVTVVCLLLTSPEMVDLAALALLSPTLGSVRTFLGTDGGTFLAWLHFLAFDLFVGRWAYLGGLRREMNSWLLRLSLFLILMVGPFGLLAYLLMGSVQRARQARS